MLGVLLLASGLFARRRQSGPLTLRGDLSDGVHTVKLSSAIVPNDVVRMAAQRSGVLGSGGVPSAAAVSACAQRINAWYRQNGYVLARVQGCRPVTEGRLELEAFEPRVARQPVRIEFYAPAVQDPPTELAVASTVPMRGPSWLPRPSWQAPPFARKMAAAAAVEWSLVPRPGASDAGASR